VPVAAGHTLKRTTAGFAAQKIGGYFFRLRTGAVKSGRSSPSFYPRSADACRSFFLDSNRFVRISGCSVLVSGCFVLISGCSVLISGCAVLVSGCAVLVSGCAVRIAALCAAWLETPPSGPPCRPGVGGDRQWQRFVRKGFPPRLRAPTPRGKKHPPCQLR
jgi:hypothetical protein